MIIYQLYNKETDLIIIFCSVDINKNSVETSEDLLSSESTIVKLIEISADKEINSLAVRAALSAKLKLA